MFFAPILLLSVFFAPASPEQPNRQPHLAGSGETVALVYGVGHTLQVRVSRDRGQSFGEPSVIAAGGKMALGRHRGPRIAVSGRSILVSAIAGEKGGGADGDLLVWRSIDGGRSWSAPTRVNAVPGSAREGLHTLAAGPGGMALAAWLDLREKGTRLYGALSKDGGGTWQPDRLIYQSPAGAVCECCHPTAAIGSDGTLGVMFRNSLSGARDLYLALSRHSGQSWHATKLGAGTWMLQACPMDGGDLKFDAGGRAITVWRREKQLFTGTGEGAEALLGTGRDPAVAWSASGPVYAWSSEGKDLLLKTPGGETPRTLDHEAGYPALIALPDGSVLAAWESGTGVKVSAIH